jgi:hypothetical protein
MPDLTKLYTDMRLFCVYGSSPVGHLTHNSNPTPIASLAKKALSYEHRRQQRKKIGYLQANAPAIAKATSAPHPTKICYNIYVVEGTKDLYMDTQLGP